MNLPNFPIEQTDSRSRARGLLVLAMLITVVAVGRVAAHDFVDWDDRFLLAGNPKFNPPTWGSVLGYVLPRNVDENLYIPVNQLFWGFLAAIGHTDHPDPSGSLLNPLVFHSANLVLHLASVALVFAIVRRFFSDIAAWIGAVIFAIHPVQVETIAWATGSRDLLAGLFGSICLLELIEYRRTNQRSCWIIATAMVALALLSKPSAVALPLEALVLDVVMLRTRILKSLGSLALWFALGIPIVLITRHVQPIVWPVENPLLARPLVALDAIAFYMTKLVAPIHLAIDYGRTPHAAVAVGWRWIWCAPIMVGALLIWKAKQWPLLAGGCLLAVAGIAPVLGLISFEAQDYSTVANHYLYPSMLGIAIIVAFLVENGVRRFGGWVIYGISAAIIAALAWQTFSATAVWSDSYSLFSNALAVNPRSSNANSGLGFALASAGDLSGAMEHFRTAEDLNPHNAMAIMGIASLLMRRGDLDGAATQYERLMQIYQMQTNFDPKLAASAETVIAAQLKRRGNSSGAIAALEQAQRWDPTNPHLEEMLENARASASTRRAPGSN